MVAEDKKEDAGASDKKGGYYKKKTKNVTKQKSNIEIVEKETDFEGSTTELDGYYFDMGPHQADDYKRTIKKFGIYVGFTYSAELACTVETLEHKPAHMFKLPKAPVTVDAVGNPT